MNSTLADQAARIAALEANERIYKSSIDNWQSEAASLAGECKTLSAQLTASRAECEELRQKHVDANEALIDTEQALVRIADAMVPGLARRLAREALPVVRAALNQKETGYAS